MRYLNHFIIFCLFSLAIASSGCSTAGKAFSKAEQFEAAGDYESAMFSYAEAFRNDPENGEYRTRFFKARDAAADKSYKTGLEHLKRGDYDAALAEFQTAYGLDSTQDRFRQKVVEVTRLRDAQMAYLEGRDFEKGNKLKEANRAYLAALELNPGNREYEEASARVSGQRKSKLAGFELSLKSSKPITLKFKDAKIKDVFKIITQLTGINFIFDDAVKDQPVSIYLENATFQQAMDLLTNMNKLHTLVLNESTVLVYPRTPEKSKQYEDLILRTFHLSYMDAKKAVNLIRTMLQVKKIHVNEESNSIVVRDSADVIAVVEKILDANDVPEPEVVLEVEVIELSSKNTQNVGLLLSDYSVKLGLFSPSNQLISSNGLTATGAIVSGTGSTSSGTASGVAGVQVAGIDNLLKVFTSKGYSGWMTVPNAQYNFGKTLAKGEVLSNPKLRVKHKEKAKFNVGQRVPITTTTSNSGTQTQVNVQYVDVGVKVNAEPLIQMNNEVQIKVSLEVSSIINKETVGGKDSATTVVTIGTKNLDTVLSLKDGETSVIGGLLQNTSTDSKQQVFLLGDIPLLGPLLSSNDKSKDKTELVLAITPRIVRGVTVPQSSLMSFVSGKEDEPMLKRPMGSFEQEPVFEGDTKDMPAKTPPAKSSAIPAAGTASKPAATGTAPAPGSGTAPAGSTAAQPAKVETSPPQPPGGGTTAALPAASDDAQSALPAVPPQAETVPVVGVAAAPAPTKRGLVQIAAPAESGVGQQFYADIKVADIQGLTGVSLVLSYDSKILEHVSTVEGTFMKRDGKPTTFSATASPADGTLTVKLSRGPSSGGLSGAGSIVSALFRAKNKGPANFSFQSVALTGTDGKPLEILPFSTAITIR